MKINKCTVCQKIFKKVKDRFFEGTLGPIPLVAHIRCYNKLIRKDELLLRDKNE